MTDDQNMGATPDWNKLAKDALDLWQSHLTSLAADPKAKEEMAVLIAPMTQMYAAWADMTQKTLQTMVAQKESAPAQAAPTTYSPPPSTSSDSPLQTPLMPQMAQPVERPVVAPVLPTALTGLTGAPTAETVVAALKALQGIGMYPGVQSQSAQTQTVAAAPVATAPVAVEPVASVAPVAPVVASPDPSAGGRALPADGARNLAELATRLAGLERELEQLRAKKRGTEAESLDSELLRKIPRGN